MNKSQQGITLLESLVALLVLSIGLLGTAHLMATGIKQTNGSFARTQATYIAENLAERMRANPQAIVDMDYEAFDSNTDATTADCTARPANWCEQINTAIPATCSSAELATFDKFQASCGIGGSANGDNGVKALLPAGQIEIICENGVLACTATSTYTIKVSWNETERADDVDVDIGVTKTKSVQHKILP